MSTRTDVDSGFDKKRIVESNIIALLKEGVPVDIVSESPNFNPKHFEMLGNLKSGYLSKEQEILDNYGGYGKDVNDQIVPDIYADVSHPVGGELYPMKAEEEYAKFEELAKIDQAIEAEKNKKIANLNTQYNNSLLKIKLFMLEYPEIVNLFNALNKLKKENNNNLDIRAYFDTLTKYAGDNNISKYDALYSEYIDLKSQSDAILYKIEAYEKGELVTDEIKELNKKREALVEEIVLRNVKLVNWFIRKRFGRILVETDDLFQICSFGLARAINDFDYRLGNKFSTLACEYMLNQVRQSFCSLTGLSWENYWRKKKIQILLKNTSNLLGREINVFNLVEYGLITEWEASFYYNVVEQRNFSDLYTSTDTYEDYEINSEYETYFGDDEIKDFNNGEVAKVLYNADGVIYNNELKKVIKELLTSLTDREAFVIRKMFGLDNGIPMSLEEVGEILSISKERVRQISAKALRKLRHPSRANQLKDFYKEPYEEYSEFKKFKI